MKWKINFIVDSIKREKNAEIKSTNESQAIFFILINYLMSLFPLLKCIINVLNIVRVDFFLVIFQRKTKLLVICLSQIEHNGEKIPHPIQGEKTNSRISCCECTEYIKKINLNFIQFVEKKLLIL